MVLHLLRVFTHSGTGTLQLLTNNLTVTGAFNNSGNGTLDLAQRSANVGDLQGGGTITNSTAATTSTLTVGNGTDANNSSFTGVIQNGSGTVALTKDRCCSLSLSGANTYSGATTLSAGTLNINSTSAIGTGSFVINGGTIGCRRGCCNA
jgi:autotransporter-associated beta strand protein